ncbi:MAG: hypothetical protein QOF36_1840, partial [Microbacteriaceae bacterium]|nr:hypothetical protein [Microbacteriaceae bacterium]
MPAGSRVDVSCVLENRLHFHWEASNQFIYRNR